MKRKLLFVCLILVLSAFIAVGAFASEIDGKWAGKIYVSKYGLTVSRAANVSFTANGGYALNLGSDGSVGTYVISGDKITLTSSGGRVLKLAWKLKGETLTMSGKMDFQEYRNLSAKMVVKRQSPKVLSVSSPKVEFAEESVITVKTNALAEKVKIELADGTLLSSSSVSEKPGVFKLRATVPLEKNVVSVYAGADEDGAVKWYAPKKAVVKTYAIARLTKITKAVLSAKAVRAGESVTVTVTANDKTTRVKVVGAETVESSVYEAAADKRVFSVTYSQSVIKKNQKLKIYSGDVNGFKASAKTVKISFTA